MSSYSNWTGAGRPNNGLMRPLARLRDKLRAYGYTVYDIGNDDHLRHVPPEDHTPFSETGWPVSPTPKWWITAIDIMPPPPGSGLPSLQQLGAQIFSDRDNRVIGFLKYMNWEPDRDNGGRCWHDSWMPNHARAGSADRGHIHLSGRSDSINETAWDHYDPVARFRGDDMSEHSDEVIERWRLGMLSLQDGSAIEPVKWRVKDEAWQAKVNADIATLLGRAPVSVDAGALATALAGNTAFVTAVANAIAAKIGDVRKIVDEELDEAFRGAADNDPVGT